MIKYLKAVTVAVLCAGSILNSKSQPALPFKMPEEIAILSFKPDTFNISNYGALGDGITKNTAAITKAINACNKSGGGVVLIPAGLWLTGPIELKSNVNIHLLKGALVLFSPDFNDYPMIFSFYEGKNTWRCQSPISGKNLENIAITGNGVFDGSGDAWRQVKKAKLTLAQWKGLISGGGTLSKDGNTWYPSEKSKTGNELAEMEQLPKTSDTIGFLAIKDFLRPVMISLIECRRILLDGPTFQNSPSWCIHPLFCEQFTIKNINVRNPWYAQNGDGIDIESCRIGILDNCTFDVGDDAICMKSGKDAEGRKRGKPTEYLIITNNVVYHGHGGFVIGSEMSGGVKNIYVANCTFLGTDIGLRFKSSRGRGGSVENIYVSNISMANVQTDAIRFDMFYGGTSPVPEGDEKNTDHSKQSTNTPEVNDGTPQFKNFHIKNIYCNGAAQAIFMQGLPEMAINNMTIEDCSFKSAKGLTCIDGDHVTIRNITLDIKTGNAVSVSNCRNAIFDHIKTLNRPGKLYKVSGKSSANITITGGKGNLTEKDIETDDDVKEQVIIE